MSEELFRAFKGGDNDAFKKYYEVFAPGIYGFVFSIVEVREDAEDIVSGCFIKVWERYQSFESPNHLKRWLFTIARNKSIDLLRSRGIEDEHLKQLLEKASDESYLEGSMMQEGLLDKIHAYVERLSPKQRDVIRLRYFEDMKYEAIAEQLGISVNYAYLTSYRALDALRVMIAEDMLPLLLFIYFSLSIDNQFFKHP